MVRGGFAGSEGVGQAGGRGRRDSVTWWLRPHRTATTPLIPASHQLAQIPPAWQNPTCFMTAEPYAAANETGGTVSRIRPRACAILVVPCHRIRKTQKRI